MKLLVVEDYDLLRDSLQRGLADSGFAVDTADNGEDGLWHATDASYDAIVLDIMLPVRDGLSVLEAIRKDGILTPVLLLTAKDQIEDRVRGLEMGADDYLVKPFAFEELLARVNALVRRRYGQATSAVHAGEVEIDTLARIVRKDGQPVDLTAREYAVLEILVMRAGETVTRTEISDHIYGFDAEPNSNAIDVYVGQLRRKIGNQVIRTRRGLGYVLERKP